MARMSDSRYTPADPGDVRFEIVSIIEETDDPEMATAVLTINDRGEVISRDTFATWDDPFSFIEAYRECETLDPEERNALYFARGW